MTDRDIWREAIETAARKVEQAGHPALAVEIRYLTPPADMRADEGWRLVPVEPTDEMVEAWSLTNTAARYSGSEWALLSDDEKNRICARGDWIAMLAAALAQGGKNE